MDQQALKQDFERFDGDSNGRIDRNEFLALVQSLGIPMSEDRAYVAFQAIDINGNGSIEFDEFASWWKRR